MKRLLLLFILLYSVNGTSQVDSYRTDSLDTHSYFVRPGLYNLRLSLGVYPEVQFINSPVIGAGISYARLLDVEWSSFNRGVNVGFEFDPLERFYGPKLTVWGDMFAIFLGLNASFSAMYYFQGNEAGLYFRPEVGIGIPRLHLKYGFGFRVAGDELTGIQRHSLTLGYHFILFERDVRK